MSIISHLNGFDYLVLLILLLSTLFGLMRGFLSETISLLTWVAAAILSFIFADKFAAFAHQYISDLLIARAVSFALIILTVLIIGGIFNYAISKALHQTSGVGIIDHLFGGIFGFARGVFILLLLIFLISNTSWHNKVWFKQSVCMQRLQGVSGWIQQQGAQVWSSDAKASAVSSENNR